MSLVSCTECGKAIHISRLCATGYQICNSCADEFGIDLELARENMTWRIVMSKREIQGVINTKKQELIDDIENLAKDTGDKAVYLKNRIKREYDRVEDEAKRNLEKIPFDNKVLWAVFVGLLFVGVSLGMAL